MVKRRGRHLNWYPPLLTTTPHQREDVLAICPTRWVFSGTGLELVTRQTTVRYVYLSATTAKGRIGEAERKAVERRTMCGRASSYRIISSGSGKRKVPLGVKG
ncbi:hypothetical protein TNCV_3153821 [Trichonephila clavipes]|nr:hypothetical protein TNCV_3153821 [Trichonephila clavipes]